MPSRVNVPVRAEELDAQEDQAERQALKKALSRIRKDGFLLSSDPHLPCLVSLIVGEPIGGSWWGHPAGGRIYRVAEQLEDHPEVLSVKLVRGKSTSVHRSWWPPLLSVAASQATWQTQNLTPGAHRLWELCLEHGQVRVDRLEGLPLERRQTAGDAAREIERRLLVHAWSVHTESGRHATELESWAHWKRRSRFRAELPPESEARRRFEQRAQRMYGRPGRRGYFPWPYDPVRSP